MPKTEAGYRAVQRRTVVMRKAGRLPYGWLTDMTRRGWHVWTFASGADLIRAYAGLYRAPLWRSSDVHVEVWCESRSLAGVLQGDCRELAVSLYPCGGFASLTLAYEAAESIAAECGRHGKESAVIVYAGDYDPAGVLIDRDVEEKLTAHLRPHGIMVSMDRVAVNPVQIQSMRLPEKPRKQGDRRRLDIQGTVEAEAMPARVMRGLVRDAVERWLPKGALEVAKVAEESEIEGLRALADHYEKGGGG